MPEDLENLCGADLIASLSNHFSSLYLSKHLDFKRLKLYVAKELRADSSAIMQLYDLLKEESTKDDPLLTAKIHILLAGISLEQQTLIQHLEEAINALSPSAFNDTHHRYLAYCHVHLCRLKRESELEYLLATIEQYKKIKTKNLFDWAFILDLLNPYEIQKCAFSELYTSASKHLHQHTIQFLEQKTTYNQLIFFSRYLPAHWISPYLFALLKFPLKKETRRIAQNVLIQKMRSLYVEQHYLAIAPDILLNWLNISDLDFRIVYSIGFFLLHSLKEKKYPAIEEVKYDLETRLISFLEKTIAKTEPPIDQSTFNFLLVYLMLETVDDSPNKEKILNYLLYLFYLHFFGATVNIKLNDFPCIYYAMALLDNNHQGMLHDLITSFEKMKINLENFNLTEYGISLCFTLSRLFNFDHKNELILNRFIQLWLQNNIRRDQMHIGFFYQSLWQEIKTSVATFTRMPRRHGIINQAKNLFAKIFIKYFILPAQFRLNKEQNCFKFAENKHSFFLSQLDAAKWEYSNQLVDRVETLQIQHKSSDNQEKPLLICFNPNSTVYQEHTPILVSLTQQLGVKLIACNFPGTGNSEDVTQTTQDVIIMSLQTTLSLIQQNPDTKNITLMGQSLGGWVATEVTAILLELKKTNPLLQNKNIKLINDRSISSTANFVEGQVLVKLAWLGIIAVLLAKIVKYAYLALSAIIPIKIDAIPAWSKIPVENKLCLVNKDDELLPYANSKTTLYKTLSPAEQARAIHVSAPNGCNQHSASFASLSIEGGNNVDFLQKIKCFIHKEQSVKQQPDRSMQCSLFGEHINYNERSDHTYSLKVN